MDEDLGELWHATREGDREAHERLLENLLRLRTGYIVVWRGHMGYTRPHPNAVPFRLDAPAPGTYEGAGGPDFQATWANAVSSLDELWDVMSWDRHSTNRACS